jgi:hypothetical protein
MAEALHALSFTWDGESMRPLIPKAADRQFVCGQVYRMEIREERSGASHRHFFAAIAEAHANLPEGLAEKLATPDHLRKYALIRAGYRDERSIACASPEEAKRMAAFIEPLDDYAFVVVTGATVTVYTAKSQSVRAMGKTEFNESKQRVLDVVSQLIGTDAATLSKASAA